MAIRRSLQILRVEDLPGVKEASRFRRRCLSATEGVEACKAHAGDCERVRSGALWVVAYAAAAWRACSWPIVRKRLLACEQARAETMRGLYALYCAGETSARRFDRAAVAGARLREAMAQVAMDIERRLKWAS
jgi:hypothetical protein